MRAREEELIETLRANAEERRSTLQSLFVIRHSSSTPEQALVLRHLPPPAALSTTEDGGRQG